MSTSDPLVLNFYVKNGHQPESKQQRALFNKENNNVDLNAKSLPIFLTIKQLEEYATNIRWKIMRYALILCFWVIWLVMFFSIFMLILFSPKCNSESLSINQKWFENALIYQIYTPTFYDFNGDGVGDFEGIEKKLDDLRRIGVKCIHPTPVITSIKDEFSPAHALDVFEIDERFGTFEDFQTLVQSAHKFSMTILIDLPLTVNSENSWASKIPGAILEKNKANISLLNINNPEIQIKLFEAAQKWLRLGVDGIHFADYGFAGKTSPKSIDQLVQKIIRAALDDSTIQQKDLFIIIDSSWITTSKTDYTYLSLTSDGDKNVLDTFVKNIEQGIEIINDVNISKPIWRFADLSTPRLDQQINLDLTLNQHKAKSIALLSFIQLILPGPISIYYGEEFGLPSIIPTLSSQFPQRGVMRWNINKPNSDFSIVSGKNFFGNLNENNSDKAFYNQRAKPNSCLKIFQRLSELRNRNWVLKNGTLSFTKNGLHLYSRYLPDNSKSDIFLLAVNWPIDGKTNPRKLNIRPEFVQKRALTNVEIKAVSENETAQIGRVLDLTSETLILQPYQAILLRIF